MLYIKKLTRTDLRDFKIQVAEAYDFFHVQIDRQGRPPDTIDIKVNDTLFKFESTQSGFAFGFDGFVKFLQEMGAEENDIFVLKKAHCKWGLGWSNITDENWMEQLEENIFPYYGPLKELEAYLVKKNDRLYDCYLEMINTDTPSKKEAQRATVAGDPSEANESDEQSNEPDANDSVKSSYTQQPQQTEQKIFYGAPGTGKSFEVKRITDGKKTFRTTFHPDYDYSNFVGAYKPYLEGMSDNKTAGQDLDRGKPTENKLTYKFVPQVFAHAYVDAWNKYNPAGDSEHVYLIIEEINRGNCAQIFGDLFQLLDRNESGFSEYMVNADEDFKGYLEEVFNKNRDYETKIRKSGLIDNDKEFDFHWIWLPPNLSILATMNTSDQSLFPMDSAFKRRWDWKYVPINYDQKEISQLKIKIGGALFSWRSFLLKINENIREITKSEDKQLGQFFIRPRHRNGDTIEFEDFRDKVIFYLWQEIYKDEIDSGKSIFGGSLFSEICSKYDRGEGYIKKIIIERLGLNVVPASGSPIGAADNDNEARETQAEAQEED